MHRAIGTKGMSGYYQPSDEVDQKVMKPLLKMISEYGLDHNIAKLQVALLKIGDEYLVPLVNRLRAIKEVLQLDILTQVALPHLSKMLAQTFEQYEQCCKMGNEEGRKQAQGEIEVYIRLVRALGLTPVNQVTVNTAVLTPPMDNRPGELSWKEVAMRLYGMNAPAKPQPDIVVEGKSNGMELEKSS